jgi:ribose-phosphate pyrophosphokinase
MKIFSGLSNPKLARRIAKELGLKLGKMEISRFPNYECRVFIKERVVNDKAIIVQSFSYPPDEQVMELCLMVDALARMGVRRIIAVIPWLGYCIQDKVFRSGEPLSSKVIVKILQAFEISRLITLDLHNTTVGGFFDFPFTEISGLDVFEKHFSGKRKVFDMIVSPDVGGLKDATKFAQRFRLPLAVINKKRDLRTGKVSILGVNQEVEGRNVLIVDDFVSSGSTLIQTAEYLKKQSIKKVYACLSHHFYVKGVQERIEKSALDKLYVTDSIQVPKDRKYPKLKVISAAPNIARTIKKYL